MEETLEVKAVELKQDVKKSYSKWREVPRAQPRKVTVLLLKRETKGHRTAGWGQTVIRSRGQMAVMACSPGNAQSCFHVPVR